MGLHLNFNFSFIKRKGLRKLPLTLAGLALIAGITTVNASQQNELGPKVTIDKETSGESCILPEAEMRRRHPDLLKHDRIQTLREGLRAQADPSNPGKTKPLDGSLKQCINCHAIKADDKYVRIDNDEHFCVSCHKYAAVTIDCFQCHRDIPEGSGDFHALSGSRSGNKGYGHGNADNSNIVPGTYNLTIKDVANIVPEVSSDDN